MYSLSIYIFNICTLIDNCQKAITADLTASIPLQLSCSQIGNK